MNIDKDESSARSNSGILKYRSAIFTVLAIAVFAIISWAYFYPDDVMGNVLNQHDVQQGVANGQECKQYTEKTGEVSRWTNSLFSGMPTFQISPSYQSDKPITWIGNIYRLGFPSPVGLVFIMMVGFYILLMAFDVKWYVAIPGAIAYGFSSYFFILIGAGHIWKFVTLAYIPPTIAGVVWCYRGKYLLGGAVSALFAALQIVSNHVQMTYYFLFVILAIAIAYLVIAIRTKTLKQWGIATAVLAFAALLGVGANASNLYNTYKYSKESMRGGHSELPAATQNAANATNGGLDRDYITAWSYGIGETTTLIIPNVKGGATIRPTAGDNKMLSLDLTPKAQELSNSGQISAQDFQYLAQFPQYFGDQPMTNGPVYVGVLIFVFFLIGCFVVKGPVKWALLIVTILSIFLSWGNNFMWLTNIFIDHFPMYNKFRTVASILVIAEFTMPLLGALALNKIFTEKDFINKNYKAIFGAFGFTAFVCIFILLAPQVFDLFSNQEKDQFIRSGIAAQVPTLSSAIETIRRSLITADALRSLIFLIMGFGVTLLFMNKKINATTTGCALAVLILVDMYSLNKRYISTTSFSPAPAPSETAIKPRPVDLQILKDTAMNYRVLDQAHFGDAAPSYFHKMIGGYHAAKLTRYQDLIDHQIANGNERVLDMLNTKYVIVGDSMVYPNPHALGNAWFVDKLDFVSSPKQEMDYLTTFNPAKQAVADARFRPVLGKQFAPKSAGDTIFETSYAPNALTYHAHSQKGGLAVFSEVYFPWGWKATIDGKDTEIGRVNYVLRALVIPAGEHTIHFKFDPQSVHVTETIGYISVVIIYLGVAAAIAFAIWRKRKDDEPEKKIIK